MAVNLYTNQSSNIAKTWFLIAGFLVLIMTLGWFASYYYQSPAILYFAVFFSVFFNIFSYWNSDKIVLKITGAKPATKEEYYDLYTLTENISITSGLPMPKIYVINDSVPNAFATGRNKEHATIVFTTGILAILEKNELEGVIAHEMAHIGNRDILLQTIVVILVGMVTLLSDFFIRNSFSGNSDRGGKSQIQSIMIIVGFILVILSPIIAQIIQLAISRKREFLADSTAALITRYPEGLANALLKIEKNATGIKMQKANHATAHMFIASPFGEHGKTHKGFLNKMFSTHPPIQDRVNALLGQKNQYEQ